MRDLDKFENAVLRVKRMDEIDESNGASTSKEIGKSEMLSVALEALRAGIVMMQDGRHERAEEVLYEAAVYFVEVGGMLKTK